MKVLVTVASRHGSTEEMARAIAATLGEAGLEAVVASPDEVLSLADYDAVVLGSAIYIGRWLDPAKSFAERFRTEFERVPLWAFSSGPIGDPPKPAGTPPEVVAILEHLHVREHRLFSGEIDRGELGFAEKLITRAVGAAEGDYRQWAEIEAWAAGIAASLKKDLGWRHEGAAEREAALKEWWDTELHHPTPAG